MVVNKLKPTFCKKKAHQINSRQWEQKVGWRRNVAMNLWPFTWCTRLLMAPRLRLNPCLSLNSRGFAVWCSGTRALAVHLPYRMFLSVILLHTGPTVMAEGCQCHVLLWCFIKWKLYHLLQEMPSVQSTGHSNSQNCLMSSNENLHYCPYSFLAKLKQSDCRYKEFIHNLL